MLINITVCTVKQCLSNVTKCFNITGAVKRLIASKIKVFVYIICVCVCVCVCVCLLCVCLLCIFIMYI